MHFLHTLTGHPGQLATCLDAARDYLDREGIDGKPRYALELAIDELVSNVVRYGGRAPDDLHVQVRMDKQGQELHLAVEDNGIPFDPVAAQEPETPTSIADAQIGGRGILMVKRMTESLRYHRIENGNATVVVVRLDGGET